MPNQSAVDTFLDVSSFLSPGRTSVQRIGDLVWRFRVDEQQAKALFGAYTPGAILPVVAQEIAPAYRLCNDCGAVLDASKQHCPQCGHQWSEI